jgi:hypothetical protein
MLNEVVYWLTIAPRLRGLQRLLPEARIHPTGSRYVCSPPVMGTDIDFLVYDPSNIDDILVAAGYVKSPFTEYHNSSRAVDDFDAWRKGKVNLIVTRTLNYALPFHTATFVCKRDNITEKCMRVAVHEALRGNENEMCFLDPTGDLFKWLEKFISPHRMTLIKIYRAQQGLEL